MDSRRALIKRMHQNSFRETLASHNEELPFFADLIIRKGSLVGRAYEDN